MRNLSALLTLLGALASVGCGKGAKGECPQLAICNGSPVGNWVVNESCQVYPVRPTQPGDVTDFTNMNPPLTPTLAPPQPNAVVAAQTTSGDWCSGLVYTMDGTVTNANLWHEAPSLVPAASTILFGPDFSYLTKLVFKSHDSTHFAPRCLMQNGAVIPTGAVNLTCDKLAMALNAFYTPLMASVPPTFGTAGRQDGIVCAAASDGGCDCDYDFNFVVDDQGTWAIDPTDPTVLVQDSTVLTYNGAVMNAQASTTTLKSSMCGIPGRGLDLSGLRGGSLSNVQGLRTLALSPMP